MEKIFRNFLSPKIFPLEGQKLNKIRKKSEFVLNIFRNFFINPKCHSLDTQNVKIGFMWVEVNVEIKASFFRN